MSFPKKRSHNRLLFYYPLAIASILHYNSGVHDVSFILVIFMNVKQMKEMLKEAGYKLTSPRKLLLSFLAKSEGIFSVSHIQRALPDLDTVTIYRNIDLFTKLDIIHPVAQRSAEQYYEVHRDEHVHQVVCDECDRSETVPCEVTTPQLQHFAHMHHTVLFTGLCHDCTA